MKKQTGFTLTELLMVLVVTLALGWGVWWVYHRLSVQASADVDRRAMTTVWGNLKPMLAVSGGRSFNSDPTSTGATMDSDPIAFAQFLQPMQCDGQWGFLQCTPAAGDGDYSFADFMSVCTPQFDSSGAYTGCDAPFNVFSFRLSYYNPTAENCLALTNGFGTETVSGASAIDVASGDWSQFVTVHYGDPDAQQKLIQICDDPSGSVALIMLEFYPWGDPLGWFQSYAPQ